jgi:hypothetical protein
MVYGLKLRPNIMCYLTFGETERTSNGPIHMKQNSTKCVILFNRASQTQHC